jgi:hypothetical protein
MAHEFNIKNGFITSGQSYVYSNLTVSGLTLSAVPANDDTLTQILARDSSGNVKYRNASSLGGGGTTGAYLPLSGGTVTGGTIFTSGVTANTISATTISKVNYIDFNTGTTNPSQSGGRVFFDNTSKALSYYDIANNLVPIAMGQQLYTRVYNATGAQLNKGSVISITGTTNGLPSASLAVNTHTVTSARPIGLAAENIPNNSEGLVLNNGVLSGITLNTFANGDTLYLSDSVPGSYVATTQGFAFTARTNEIGYVLQTGSTTGKIYVNINNEDSNLSLTDIERNILEGNVLSTGVYQYTGMTQGTGQTINVALVRGWTVQNTYSYATVPDVTNIYYTGGTNIPLTYLNSADATYVLITSASTLLQQTTFPTPQQRRQNLFLGKVVHPNRSTITSINQTVDFDVSPMAAIRDLWTPLKLINQGIIVSPNGANMNINTSAGTLWGNGIGWTTNQLNPDSISLSGTSPTTFQYRTQNGPITGGTVVSGNTTTINPAYYDNNGVITAVGGGANSSTNQRIYQFPTGLVRIQLGQQVYGSLSAAVAGAQTEQFVEYGNNRDNGILIGILSVNKNATDLSNTGQAVFNLVSKFGEVLGGTGGLSTTTLQQAYDNSTNPEIVINSTLDGLSIKNGTGNPDISTNLLEGINAAGATTSFIRADGAFSGTGVTASTIYATTYLNLPTDIRVTGGTYSAGTATFRNNTGGTFSVTGFSTGSSVTQGVTGVTGNNGLSATTTNNVTTIGFSGGTINSSVNFNGGLSANTISATTYQGNLVTSVGAGSNITVNQSIGSVTVTAIPTGSAGQIQYSDGSNFAANANLTYDATSDNFAAASPSYTLNSVRSSTVAGLTNTITDSATNSFIGGGESNTIRNNTDSAIIGGNTNLIDANANNTVILGGNNINATVSNSVYVPTLYLATSLNNDDSLTQVLVRDGSGVVKYRTASSLAGGGGTFSGGTVTGPSNFTAGLTANTISATTYYNLPIDVFVTGGTYSTGTATFRNNTGGTFTVTGFYTGNSITQGITGVTGNNGLSATTTNNVTTIGFSGGNITSNVNFINNITAGTYWDGSVNLTDAIYHVQSTGVELFTGLTRLSTTTFSVGPVVGYVAVNSGTNDIINVNYSGTPSTTTPYLNTSISTYVLVSSASTLVLQSTFPTPQQRRENIFLGRIAHPDKTTIVTANNTVDIVYSPMSVIRDMFTAIPLINENISVTYSASSLGIQTTGGNLWGMGINFTTNQYDPDRVVYAGAAPATFQYRTQTGGTYANTTTLDVAYWDNAGVRTAVTGTVATNQRVYLFPSGQIRIQYGQKQYADLTSAVSGLFTESFVTFENNRLNAILIGVISVLSNATNLGNSSQAFFSSVSKFGEVLGGTGGLATTTLQQAYQNSSDPAITTNSTNGALEIRGGTGNNNDLNFTVQNNAGTTTGAWNAGGNLTATTISATTYYNLPVSGLTQGSNITITNNGLGNYTIASTGGGGTFTGGTVTGATNFTGGLSANTISATTYVNLPVSGLTQGTNITITNNGVGNYTISSTGGSSGTFTGGTVSGATIFTNGVSANTITITATPTNNDTNTQILSRNSTSGNVEYVNSSVFTSFGTSFAMAAQNYMT